VTPEEIDASAVLSEAAALETELAKLDERMAGLKEQAKDVRKEQARVTVLLRQLVRDAATGQGRLFERA
jgi:hypothetical protein